MLWLWTFRLGKLLHGCKLAENIFLWLIREDVVLSFSCLILCLITLDSAVEIEADWNTMVTCFGIDFVLIGSLSALPFLAEPVLAVDCLIRCLIALLCWFMFSSLAFDWGLPLSFFDRSLGCNLLCLILEETLMSLLLSFFSFDWSLTSSRGN